MADRMEELRDTLARLAAIQLATHQLKDGDGSIMGRTDFYAVNGRVLIVQVHYRQRLNQVEAARMEREDAQEPMSWDLFIPVSDSGRIDVTLDALERWARKGNSADQEEEAYRLASHA